MCNDSDKGSYISVIGCPANLKVSRALQMNLQQQIQQQIQQQQQQLQQQLQQQQQQIQQQIQQQMQQVQQQVQQAQQQASQAVAAANKKAANCPSWTKVSDNSSIQASSPGMYCTNSTGGYKCNSSNGSDISIVGCPANLKTSRALKNKFGDALDTTTAAPVTDAPADTTSTAAPVTDAQATTDEWSDFDNEMKELDQEIQDCKKWTPMESNNITEGGLYCNDDSGKMFKCSENPLKGNEISTGSCPNASDNHEANTDVHKMWFWY
jgi:TolA-binding protein